MLKYVMKIKFPQTTNLRPRTACTTSLNIDAVQRHQMSFGNERNRVVCSIRCARYGFTAGSCAEDRKKRKKHANTLPQYIRNYSNFVIREKLPYEQMGSSIRTGATPTNPRLTRDEKDVQVLFPIDQLYWKKKYTAEYLAS